MHLFKENAPADMDAAVARIPVIDFGPYFAGKAGALARLGGEVRRACETAGFIYILNHGVPEALIAAHGAVSEPVAPSRSRSGSMRCRWTRSGSSSSTPTTSAIWR